MIDTIVLFLPWAQAGGVKYSDIAARVPLAQTFAPAEEDGRRACVKATGRACGMRVQLNAGGILIGDSLCKSSLHNNFDALTPKQIVDAIAVLEDTLGVNLRPARIYQIDYGLTVPVPPSFAAANVLEACGDVPRYRRKPIGEPLECVQYGGNGKRCILYNKQLEARRHVKDGDIIPATWAGVDAVRCEVQLPNSQDIKSVFGRALTVADISSCEVQKCMAENWMNWVNAVFLKPKQSKDDMITERCILERIAAAVKESRPQTYREAAQAIAQIVLAAVPDVLSAAQTWADSADDRRIRSRYKRDLTAAAAAGRNLLCTECFPAPAPAISAEQIAAEFKASALAAAERWTAQIAR